MLDGMARFSPKEECMNRWTGIRRRRSRILPAVAAAALAAGTLFAVPAVSHAAPLTVVTIQFDDGNADVYQWLSSLNTHGFPATFYVNSGTIATAGKMTWAQLTALAQAGNEIASHTIDHVDIKKLPLAAARYQVCQDRVNLAAHGFQPESFAYPYGDYNATVETQVVRYCGDNSARTVSGVNDHKVFAETIPPANPYATRTPPDPKKATKLAALEGYVTSAEQHGGGWVQLTFHHICNRCDAYSITAAHMQALLDWLSTQAASGAVAVDTTEQVIGGTYKTPFCC
jgi:peptidoglycan/xylan/chitin deacetylase (PgdA/CDA1 family)